LIAGCSNSRRDVAERASATAGATTDTPSIGAHSGSSCDLCAKWREHWCALQDFALREIAGEIPKEGDTPFVVDGKRVVDREGWCVRIRHAGAFAYGVTRGIASAGSWLSPDPDQARAFELADLAIALDKAAEDCEPEHAAETVLKMQNLAAEYGDKLASKCGAAR
jgi:hypothetical protein